MINVVWDMETSDPDDYLTLLLLIDHPDVNLKAVNITPGTPWQIGLVRPTLPHFERDIPVGAFNIDHQKQCVSAWHEKVYGVVEPSRDAIDGAQLLREHCDQATTLITGAAGAALRNAGKAIRESASEPFSVGRMVIQGGFAGDGVVPADNQLEKFRGRVTCPTFNLNGD